MSFSPETQKPHESDTGLLDSITKKINSFPSGITGNLSDLKARVEEAKSKGSEALKAIAKEVNQTFTQSSTFEKLKSNQKFEKLLKGRENFESVSAGDILRIKKGGENLASFLISNRDGESVQINSETVPTLTNTPLQVSFGKNRSINASIGLGDILPQEVKQVKVIKPNGEVVLGTLGTKDSRSNRNSRLGYYDEKGRYIAVYDGYRFEILSTGTVSATEKNTFDTFLDNRIKQVRIDEMVSRYMAVGEKYKDEFHDPDDMALLQEAETEIKNNAESARIVKERFGNSLGKGREAFLDRFGTYIGSVAEEYGIPAHIIVNLIEKESAFRSDVRSSAGAYGLGQHRDGAWNAVKESLNKDLNRNNPYDQILAVAEYLKISKEQSNAKDWIDAVVYYHTGTGVSTYIRENNQEKLRAYKSSNPAIASKMTSDSWEGYMDAARRYYTEGLPTSINLASHKSTPLAKQLADFVVAESLPRTGKNSCGAAVGEWLNRFGIKDLPQSGRDGHNWDQFLDKRSNQFEKVYIGHPDKAQPGAVLVYDQGSIKGSDANKIYGHVEIKGSDDKYYSFYAGNRPGGSAANNEKDPERYKQLTSFTGYAYYPISKAA